MGNFIIRLVVLGAGLILFPPLASLIIKKKSVKSKKIISNEASFESIVVDMSSVLLLSDVIVTATGLDVISPRAAGLTSLQARDR